MEFKNRQQIGDFLKYHNLNNLGLELGSFKGEFAKTILSEWPGKLIMVDVWRELPLEEYDDSSNHSQHENVFIDAMNNIKTFEDRAFMWRMDSVNACEFVVDNSLDFIYIDANHTYESVCNDLKLWYPKVKKGGFVMGHDYLPDYFYENKTEKNQPLYTFPDGKPELAKYTGMFGVNPAVDEFCESLGYEVNKTEEFLSTWWIQKKY